ncbi:hypothetical protein QBK99_01915 [Corticibacterium sp. UT-5YL-CI-8]|nr:hypothetical protein [Tianweitania sp. UT-5YL-CI-8]
MKKLALTIASLALLGGTAFAAVPLSGTVKSFNQEARVITFTNGESVTVPLDVAIPAGLHAGGHASVDFSHGQVETVFLR